MSKICGQRPIRLMVMFSCCLLLAIIYIFQGFNFLSFFLVNVLHSQVSLHPFVFFIFNKTVRLCLNDVACFGLIWAIFVSREHLRLAFYVFLFELIAVLPIYFFLKLHLEGDSEISSPLLSQIHRLIVNPTLMILLMISFAYQRYKK